MVCFQNLFFLETSKAEELDSNGVKTPLKQSFQCGKEKIFSKRKPWWQPNSREFRSVFLLWAYFQWPVEVSAVWLRVLRGFEYQKPSVSSWSHNKQTNFLHWRLFQFSSNNKAFSITGLIDFSLSSSRANWCYWSINEERPWITESSSRSTLGGLRWSQRLSDRLAV